VPVPLPNLDTRRWLDLTDEGRALIPRYAPDWTDFNVHDPGLTLIELMAWQVEQELYRANRITTRHRTKFLELIGFRPAGAQPAHAVLLVTPSATGAGAVLPAGVTFEVVNGSNRKPFRTTTPLRLFGGRLVTVLSSSGGLFTDLGGTIATGRGMEAFGPDPLPPGATNPESGSALYLGFDQTLVAGAPISLWLWLDGPGATAAERQRVTEELHARATDRLAACGGRAADGICEGAEGQSSLLDEFDVTGSSAGGSAASDRATVAWEYWDGTEWRSFDSDAGEVVDETDSLRFSGAVHLSPVTSSVATVVGPVTTPRHYVRVRHSSGHFDSAPALRRIAVNAVESDQRRPAWSVVDPGERAPEPGGSQTAVVGVSDGSPGQSFSLPGTAVAGDSIRVWVASASGPQPWRLVPHLDASVPNGADVMLEGHALRFGDGRRGSVPDRGAAILVAFDDTAGGEGGVAADRNWRLPAGDLNEAVLGSAAAVAAARDAIGVIANPEPTWGGADREVLEHVAGRAAEQLWAHERLVELAEEVGVDTLDRLGRRAVLDRAAPPRATTLFDLERLALDLPGHRVARARAFASVDSSVPCRRAPGTVTVVVIPWLPRGRPSPTNDLLADLTAYLERRRVLGMRLVVVGPRYIEIGVQAEVSIRPGTDQDLVMRRIATTVEQFLDPLEGGAAQTGWPFGRDVYRAEILAVIDRVAGVDHVVRLRITATPIGDAAGGPDGSRTTEPSCGNVCLGPARLPVAGQFQIEAVA
jgi:predicted phage baseplate assembly protein